MVLHGKINFKEAIIVDEKLLRELEKVILEFFAKVEYSSTLCNEDRIDFDSLDELLDYENTSKRKIVRLEISFGYCNQIVFEPTISYISSYKNTVFGKFSLNDSDSSILFQEKVKSALDKGKRSVWYTILTKISLFYFMVTLFGISACLNLHMFLEKGFIKPEADVIQITGLSLMFTAGIFGLATILSKCRNKMLPPISFMIGEQIAEIKKGEDLFSKIFWGVIVAFVVSVITTLIL